MKKKTLAESFRQLKAEIAPMPFSKKVDHLWTYYKEYLLVTAVALLIVGGVLSGLVSAGKELLLSGTAVNVKLSADGYTYLSEAYFEKLEGNAKRQHLDFSYVYFGDPGDYANAEMNYNSSMSVIARVAAEMLDYLIMNELALESYIDQEMFLDLREFFTPEEMTEWAQQVIYVEPEGAEEMFPVAIVITELPFVQDCVETDGPIYLAFTGNSPRKAAMRDFWEYLLAWETHSVG